MYLFFLVVHIIITFLLIGIILIQRSSSDGLSGLGGGNQFMSGKTAANFLTRSTATLATLFMLNCLVLANITAHRHHSSSIIDKVTTAPHRPSPASKPNDVKPALKLKDESSSVPAQPAPKAQ